MEEYISKSYLRSILTAFLNNSNGAEHYAYGRVLKEINNIPCVQIGLEVQNDK